MKPLDSFTLGKAHAEQNPLTGDWLVYGHGFSPYVMATKNYAIRMAATVDLYVRTGERKKFSLAEARKLVESKKADRD